MKLLVKAGDGWLKGGFMGKNTGLIAVLVIMAAVFLFYTYKPAGTTFSSTDRSNTNADINVNLNQPCGANGLADFDVKFRNGLASAAEYNGATVYYVNSGTNEVIGSGTAASTGLYASSDQVLRCGEMYSAVIMDDANYVAVNVGPSKADSPKEEYEVVGANSTELRFKWYTMAYGNETTPSTEWTFDNTTGTNNAMGAGSVLDLRFDVQTASSGAQFGSLVPLTETDTGVTGQAFICADADPAYFSKQNIIISYNGIISESATLPKFCAVSGYEKAWVVKAFSSNDGTQSGTVHILSDLQAPGDDQNVKFIFVDNGYYKGSNGKLKIGSADDGNGDTGETNRYTIVNLT